MLNWCRFNRSCRLSNSRIAPANREWMEIPLPLANEEVVHKRPNGKLEIEEWLNSLERKITSMIAGIAFQLQPLHFSPITS